MEDPAEDTDLPLIVDDLPPKATSSMKKAASGAFSGAVCCLIFSPLDVARTRLQVQGALGNTALPVYSGIVGTLARIRQEEGIAGWFRGFAPAILTVPVFWSLYFPLYDWMKPVVAETLCADRRHPSVHMLSAISAGLAINVLTNPLWVVRTRLQTQALHGEKGAGMLSTLSHIYAFEGWRAFYRGLGASTLGLSHIAIQFPVYEWTKATIGHMARPATVGGGSREREGRGQSLAGGAPLRPARSVAESTAEEQQPTWVVLAASFASKLLASTVTYPHELVRARLQDQRVTAGKGAHYNGIIDVVSQTVRREGVAALWHGFRVNLVRAVPQSMITFGLYEWLIWRI